MTVDTASVAAARVVASRQRLIRAGALRGLLAPASATVYALATWGGPHRGAMVAVTFAVVTAQLLTWWRAPWIASSRRRIGLQLAGLLFHVSGSTALGLLDGGIASPLGACLPFSMIFMAVMMPPRAFTGALVVTVLAYWSVALTGGPAPPGYAVVHTLGFCGVSYLCLRHASALASLRRRLAEVSRIDPLTRCLNRRGFDERLAQALAEARRTGGRFTLVLADLDRFKEVNDTYGHRAGDELLAWTGRALEEGLRPYDAVGRLGGDEFGVLVADSGPDAVEAILGRLRASLGETVPASLGAASYPADGVTIEELKHLADQRVYLDKNAGRRRSADAEAVARVSAPSDRKGTARVSRLERSRRSTADLGSIIVVNNAIGLLYVALFGSGTRPLIPIALLLSLSGLVGASMIVVADRLSKVRTPKRLLYSLSAISCLTDTAAVALDGGVTSPMALGILVPMPLIALTLPVRRALPMIVGLGGFFAALGVFVGAPSGWYVVMHLAGGWAVSVVCAQQGRAAAKQRELLTRLSRVDVLTDCLNRRGFEERFDAALVQLRRTGRPVALLLLDLDGFKQLNDSRGHAAGDELLCWVADTLRAQMRPHDLVGRLGGDEFVVLLTNSTMGDAQATATRLRRLLAERTSVSIGIAGSMEQGADFDTLYGHADAALYRQKAGREGRRPGVLRASVERRAGAPSRAAAH